MNPSSIHPSPSGRYRLEIVSQEISMSHWIDAPFLYDNRTNGCILHLYGRWEASKVDWASQGEKVSMDVRHFGDSSVTFRFEVDLETETATLTSIGYRVVLSGTIDGVVGEMQNTTEVRTIFY